METTEMELKHVDKESASPGGDPDNNNVESEDVNEVNRGNGNHLVSDTEEQQRLLSSQQGAESNGGHISVDVEQATTQSGAQVQKLNVLKRLKNDLNEPVFGKVKVWMAILVLLVFIISFIFLLLFLCSGHKDDADDQYDRSSFVTPLHFNGSFRLANSSFVQDLLSQTDRNYELFKDLNQKLTNIYTSSPALERYFFRANVETMRYSLVFKIPEEDKQLARYTLSREVVYYVLLQNLLDQDTEDQLYIEPSSLSLERVDN